jgi:hypothetical protein
LNGLRSLLLAALLLLLLLLLLVVLLLLFLLLLLPFVELVVLLLLAAALSAASALTAVLSTAALLVVELMLLSLASSQTGTHCSLPVAALTVSSSGAPLFKRFLSFFELNSLLSLFDATSTLCGASPSMPTSAATCAAVSTLSPVTIATAMLPLLRSSATTAALSARVLLSNSMNPANLVVW